jgi:hypothetical protein
MNAVFLVLDSMSALAAYRRAYRRGAVIPSEMWGHAEVIGVYLGYPPVNQWLWQWLNRSTPD